MFPLDVAGKRVDGHHFAPAFFGSKTDASANGRASGRKIPARAENTGTEGARGCGPPAASSSARFTCSRSFLRPSTAGRGSSARRRNGAGWSGVIFIAGTVTDHVLGKKAPLIARKNI